MRLPAGEAPQASGSGTPTASPGKPGAPRVAHFVLVTDPRLDQPHHVQLRGANGEKVMWSENYADERDAMHVLDVVSEAVREGERLKRERGGE